MQSVPRFQKTSEQESPPPTRKNTRNIVEKVSVPRASRPSSSSSQSSHMSFNQHDLPKSIGSGKLTQVSDVKSTQNKENIASLSISSMTTHTSLLPYMPDGLVSDPETILDLMADNLDSEWEPALADGRIFFINTRLRTTTWTDPRYGRPPKYDPPAFRDNLRSGPRQGTDIPKGWGYASTFDGRLFFWNKNERQTTWQDPRPRDVVGNDPPSFELSFFDDDHDTVSDTDPKPRSTQPQNAFYIPQSIGESAHNLEAKPSFANLSQQQFSGSPTPYRHSTQHLDPVAGDNNIHSSEISPPTLSRRVSHNSRESEPLSFDLASCQLKMESNIADSANTSFPITAHHSPQEGLLPCKDTIIDKYCLLVAPLRMRPLTPRNADAKAKSRAIDYPAQKIEHTRSRIAAGSSQQPQLAEEGTQQQGTKSYKEHNLQPASTADTTAQNSDKGGLVSKQTPAGNKYNKIERILLQLELEKRLSQPLGDFPAQSVHPDVCSAVLQRYNYELFPAESMLRLRRRTSRLELDDDEWTEGTKELVRLLKEHRTTFQFPDKGLS